MEIVFQWEKQTVKRVNKKSISYLRRLSHLWKNKAKEREFGVLGYNFKWDDQGRPSLRTCHLNKAKEETNHMTIVGRAFEGEEIIQRVIHRSQPYVFKERGWHGWKREHEGEINEVTEITRSPDAGMGPATDSIIGLGDCPVDVNWCVIVILIWISLTIMGLSFSWLILPKVQNTWSCRQDFCRAIA